MPAGLTQRQFAIAGLIFLLFTLILYVNLGSEAKAPKKRTPPSTGTFERKIVAIGDLHGDYGNMMEVLKMAKVVDDAGKWSGNVDFLVQTGDIIDRGDDTINLYRYLENLRAQAQGAGGDIRSHFGNHEIMNLIGDWRYVPSSEITTFGGIAARQRMLTTGWIGRAWRANYTITTRLPLHPSLGPVNTDYDPSIKGDLEDLSHAALSFLHGGLSPTYGELTPYPSRINTLGATLVGRMQDRKVQPPPHPPADYPGLPADSTKEEHDLYSANGPLWYRGWATDREAVVCKAVDGVLEKTGVRRLVMGHTPHFDGIVSRCDGKVLLIDTWISHAYWGVLSAAKFTYSLTPSGTDGQYVEKDLVEAIYQDRVDTLVSSTRNIVAPMLSRRDGKDINQ